MGIANRHTNTVRSTGTERLMKEVCIVRSSKHSAAYAMSNPPKANAVQPDKDPPVRGGMHVDPARRCLSEEGDGRKQSLSDLSNKVGKTLPKMTCISETPV